MQRNHARDREYQRSFLKNNILPPKEATEGMRRHKRNLGNRFMSNVGEQEWQKNIQQYHNDHLNRGGKNSMDFSKIDYGTSRIANTRGAVAASRQQGYNAITHSFSPPKQSTDGSILMHNREVPKELDLLRSGMRRIHGKARTTTMFREGSSQETNHPQKGNGPFVYCAHGLKPYGLSMGTNSESPNMPEFLRTEYQVLNITQENATANKVRYLFTGLHHGKSLI